MSKVKIKIEVGQFSYEGEIRSDRAKDLFRYIISQLECPECKGNIETCECILQSNLRILETEEIV